MIKNVSNPRLIVACDYCFEEIHEGLKIEFGEFSLNHSGPEPDDIDIYMKMKEVKVLHARCLLKTRWAKDLHQGGNMGG